MGSSLSDNTEGEISIPSDDTYPLRPFKSDALRTPEIDISCNFSRASDQVFTHCSYLLEITLANILNRESFERSQDCTDTGQFQEPGEFFVVQPRLRHTLRCPFFH